MNAGAKALLDIGIGIGVVVIAVLAFSLIGYVVGIGVIHFFPDLIKEGANPIGVGLTTIFMIGFVGFVLYLLVSGGISMGKRFSGFVVARYEGEPYECKIFEECKDEE